MRAAFEQPVEYRLGQVAIMEHLAQCRQRLVGGDDDRPPLQVPQADDAEEHVGGVRGVALVAEFVDDEHVRMDVRLQRVVEITVLHCGR
jgi:hypothetical protein